MEKFHNDVVDLPVGTFRESGTMVKARIVVIDKPHKSGG